MGLQIGFEPLQGRDILPFGSKKNPRRLSGNQLYLLTAILAHNLTRELQMRTERKARGTTEKRTPLWHFDELATMRHHILQRAGRFTRPKGKLTLTITDRPVLRKDIIRLLDALKEAA
jgi:hypothetical protein